MAPRTVLVASSLTPQSDEVVRLAARAARGGRLEMAHALELSAGGEGGPPEFHGSAGEWLEMLAERAREALRRQAARLGLPPEDVTFFVGFGEPLSVLSRRLRERAPWLFVVGAHDGAADRRRPGALAHRLAQEGRCPTLVVRPGRPFPPRRVMAALDFSAESEAALTRALELVRLAGGEPPALEWVHALHVAPWQDLVAGGSAHAEEECRRRLADVAGAGVPDASRRARTTLLVGAPRERLLEHVEREGPDLVTAGLSGYGGLDRLLAGSVAERLVRDASASVLVVPPRVSRAETRTARRLDAFQP